MAKIKATIKDNIIENLNENTVEGLTFNNVSKLNEEEYNVILSGYELATMWDSEKLHFFGEIQRGLKPKKNNKTGEIRYVPICSEKNIKEMTNLIINDNFYTSQLTVTIIKTGNESIEFNEDENTLTVTGTPVILDGNHRVRSLHKVYLFALISDDTNLMDRLKKLMFPIKITHYDVTSAKEAFSQFAKGLKISKSKAESFDLKNASNRIVNKLNKFSVLKDRIDTAKTSITKNDTQNIYTFATLNEAIKNEFGVIQNEKEEEEIYEFLSLFFDELFKIFTEFLDDESRQLSKEFSMTCENMTVYGYMAIAEQLYLKRFGDWRSELANISKIDFDKESDVWQPIVRVNDDKIALVNNKQTRSILAKIMKTEFYRVQSL